MINLTRGRKVSTIIRLSNTNQKWFSSFRMGGGGKRIVEGRELGREGEWSGGMRREVEVQIGKGTVEGANEWYKT